MCPLTTCFISINRTDRSHEHDPSWHEVTARDLFAHRSGVGNETPVWLLTIRLGSTALPQKRLNTARDTLSKPRVREYGEFHYANLNYVIAGAMMEQATGKSWETLVHDSKIGQKMRAGSFGFGPPQGEAIEGHRRSGKTAKPVGQSLFRADNPATLGPAGTLHADLRAWARVAEAMLAPGETISETIHATVTQPWGGSETGYALGWGRQIDPDLGPILAHAGSNTMWLSQIVILEDAKLAVLVVTNLGGKAGQDAVTGLTRDIALYAADSAYSASPPKTDN